MNQKTRWSLYSAVIKKQTEKSYQLSINSVEIVTLIQLFFQVFRKWPSDLLFPFNFRAGYLEVDFILCYVLLLEIALYKWLLY